MRTTSDVAISIWTFLQVTGYCGLSSSPVEDRNVVRPRVYERFWFSGLSYKGAVNEEDEALFWSNSNECPVMDFEYRYEDILLPVSFRSSCQLTPRVGKRLRDRY